MSSHECATLFSPFVLKGLKVKNRLVRSAMETGMADLDGYVTIDNLNIYRMAAEGGVGLIITEAIGVHLLGRSFHEQIAAWEDKNIPGLKQLSDEIHIHGDGAVVFAQLQSAGASGWGYSYGQVDTEISLDTMHEEQIETLIQAFGEAAARVKKAGFDGIEFHGGHGYIISQFLSPAVNHRTDKWGGSLEKRMRFPLEIYRAVRQKVGNDFPVGIKMNTADYLPGGHWVQDTFKIAKRFAEEGFDFIEASGGMGFMTELRESLRKKVDKKEYYFSEAVDEFVDALKGTDTALMVVGGIGSPRVMEKLLDQGVDFISLARPWLAEPDFANRVKAGDLRMSRCVSRERLCNLCLTKLATGSVTCYKFYPGYCRMECPIDQDVPGYTALIAQEKFNEALKVIKRDNPLAGVLSRVCDHQCEQICRGETGEPLSIRDLKRFVTDYGLKHSLMVTAEMEITGGRGKVAIIGSGPAGLTCGFYLAKLGYNPTIFEKLPVKGGMLETGIPRYRLPKEVLKADIAYIESAGVEIKTGMALGEDYAVKDLFEQNHKAIFLAMGAPVGAQLNIEGADLDGVLIGLDFLKDVNLDVSVEVGKRVVVIGGGSVAVDVAMTAVRLGAEKVQLVCVESREEMPAYLWELEDAVEEGVVIHDSWGPKQIKGDGRVTGVELVECTSVFDHQGVFCPEYDENVVKSLSADTVIIAIGHGVDRSVIEGVPGITVAAAGTIEANKETLETGIPGVFAGADVVTGPNSVVKAVAAGKAAAESIDRYIKGISLLRTPKQEKYSPFVKMLRPTAFIEPSEQILKENSLRQVAPKRSASERRRNFKEIAGRLSKEQAIQEAKRCLKYDLELEEKSAARMADMGKATFVLTSDD
ncbi:MAG: FAD-dependent oxidoreductase [Deltaproteobacteria bacterium]|jgi:NADPH-dependent glutamate synthase beta subunit-like oxidoreductase/2,4-dienoyl-CoA reductase-like NADH-dependent reductase (Old Yellow Enzyme family)|nr:FAD-dependent oxidoreductase [Deltaproteobacteria bacterium]